MIGNFRREAESVTAERAAAWLADQGACSVQIGIILGSGLNSLATLLQRPQWFEYDAIPGFVRATAHGHVGRLGIGRIGDTTVAVMDGRFHAYEGYSLQQVTLPIGVLHRLGASRMLMTCASGGLHPVFRSGELMAVAGHLNLIGAQPGRRGPVEGGSPIRREVYPRRLIDQAQQVARQNGFPLHVGTYAAMTGPNYETRAEYRWLRRLGADAVGMSTVPEALTAATLGMDVLAVAVIANICHPDRLQPTDSDHVIDSASRASTNLTNLLLGLLARWER